MFLDTRHVEPPLILFIHALRFRIHEPIHGIVCTGMGSRLAVLILRSVTPHTGPASRAAALALVVASQSIAASEATAALGADMRTLARMQFCMSFEIVQSAEARLARLTDIRLLLAMSEEMAFEVVMSRELGGTVRTAMFLRGWGSLPGLIKPRRRQTQAATRVADTWIGHGVGEGFVAGVLGQLCLVAMTRTITILGRGVFDGTGTGDGGCVHQRGGIIRRPKGVGGGRRRGVGVDLHLIGHLYRFVCGVGWLLLLLTGTESLSRHLRVTLFGLFLLFRRPICRARS